MWKDLGTWRDADTLLTAFCRFEGGLPQEVRVNSSRNQGGVVVTQTSMPYAAFKALVGDWVASIAQVERQAGYPPRNGEAA